MLEANFDSNKGRYLNGYSDERIAQELGVSKQLVVDAREMEFGVLKVDEAAQALADDIQALNALIVEKESEWQRVVSNVDREINDLKVQAREMKTRLDKLLA